MVRGPSVTKINQPNQPKGRWSRRCARRLWGNFPCLHPWNGSCLATSVLGFLVGVVEVGGNQIPTDPEKIKMCLKKGIILFFKGKIVIQSNHHFSGVMWLFRGALRILGGEMSADSDKNKDAPAAKENHMRFDFIPLSASSGDFWNQSIWKTDREMILQLYSQLTPSAQWKIS